MTQQELHEIQQKYKRHQVSIVVDMASVSGAVVSPAMKSTYRYVMMVIFLTVVGLFLGGGVAAGNDSLDVGHCPDVNEYRWE
jgi:hypothetical protein